MWSGFTAVSALYFLGTSIWLTGAFRSVQWILLGVVSTSVGIAMTALVARLRSGVMVWGIAPAVAAPDGQPPLPAPARSGARTVAGG